MEYGHLRGTGISASRLSLGTMTFGAQADEATSDRMIRLALDAGIDFIDTADAYVGGRSEEIVGRALKGVRDKVVLATKIANHVGPGRRDGGLNRYHIIKGVEDSLRRLQTDHIDIYYWHRPDDDTGIEETLAAFDTLVSQGKVLYMGMSNFASWQVCEVMWKANVHTWPVPVVLQLPYNLITRGVEDECVAFMDKMGLGMTVYNPLAGGLLTGKQHEEAGPIKGTRFDYSSAYFDRYWQDVNFRAVGELGHMAKDAGLTLIELALRWLLAQPHVSSIILGASKIEHLESNIKAAQGTLSEDVMDACDAIWAQVRGPSFKYNR